ncbi:MAG: hypothetical protein AB1589_18760 [Cyanobacteriota bacterium]
MTVTTTPAENYPLGWINNGKGIQVEKKELSRVKHFKYIVKFDLMACFDTKHILTVEGFNYLKDIFNNDLKEVSLHDNSTPFFIDIDANIWNLKTDINANSLILKIFNMDKNIHFCLNYDHRSWYSHDQLIDLSILIAKDRKFSYGNINSNLKKDYLEAAADLYNELNRDGYTPCDKVIELADFFLKHPKINDSNRVARRKKIRELALST